MDCETTEQDDDEGEGEEEEEEEKKWSTKQSWIIDFQQVLNKLNWILIKRKG